MEETGRRAPGWPLHTLAPAAGRLLAVQCRQERVVGGGQGPQQPLVTPQAIGTVGVVGPCGEEAGGGGDLVAERDGQAVQGGVRGAGQGEWARGRGASGRRQEALQMGEASGGPRTAICRKNNKDGLRLKGKKAFMMTFVSSQQPI